jgi:hypothetical protein
MTRTTTAIWVIFIGVGGATIFPFWPLLVIGTPFRGHAEPGEHAVQVAGRVAAVVDGAAADHDVGSPARDLGGVGHGHAAVDADHDRPAGLGREVADGGHPAPGVRRGRLAGPAGVDGQHQHQVGQLQERLHRGDRGARSDRHPAQHRGGPRRRQRGELLQGPVRVPGGLGVHGDHGRAGRHDVRQQPARLVHQQVGVHRDAGRGHRGDKAGADGQLRAERPVHDVHVRPASGAAQDGQLVTEPGQVGGQHAGAELGPGPRDAHRAWHQPPGAFAQMTVIRSAEY